MIKEVCHKPRLFFHQGSNFSTSKDLTASKIFFHNQGGFPQAKIFPQANSFP